MKYISNAFSLNMMTVENFSLVRIKKISISEIPADVKSVIGHPDTASVVSNILGFETPYNRVSLTLESDDVLYVAQYKGRDSLKVQQNSLRVLHLNSWMHGYN